MADALQNNWMTFRTPLGSVEQADAFFETQAFSPHRHDTYAIGTTTAGVQTFNYRGGVHHALPGQVFVLHPDEVHDGRPGTETGYGYRIFYLSPDLISEALGRQALPFVPDPVSDDPRLKSAVGAMLEAVDDGAGDVCRTDAICLLSDALREASGRDGSSMRFIDLVAMRAIREQLIAATEQGIRISQLERDHGLDRFSICRQFRRAYGVSPHRFVTMRRLDRAKHHLRVGTSLADTAAAVGFADQSHLTRHFRNAFGITPGRWRSCVSMD